MSRISSLRGRLDGQAGTRNRRYQHIGEQSALRAFVGRSDGLATGTAVEEIVRTLNA